MTASAGKVALFFGLCAGGVGAHGKNKTSANPGDSKVLVRSGHAPANPPTRSSVLGILPQNNASAVKLHAQKRSELGRVGKGKGKGILIRKRQENHSKAQRNVFSVDSFHKASKGKHPIVKLFVAGLKRQYEVTKRIRDEDLRNMRDTWHVVTRYLKNTRNKPSDSNDLSQNYSSVSKARKGRAALTRDDVKAQQNKRLENMANLKKTLGLLKLDEDVRKRACRHLKFAGKGVDEMAKLVNRVCDLAMFKSPDSVDDADWQKIKAIDEAFQEFTGGPNVGQEAEVVFDELARANSHNEGMKPFEDRCLLQGVCGRSSEGSGETLEGSTNTVFLQSLVKRDEAERASHPPANPVSQQPISNPVSQQVLPRKLSEGFTPYVCDTSECSVRANQLAQYFEGGPMSPRWVSYYVPWFAKRLGCVADSPDRLAIESQIRSELDQPVQNLLVRLDDAMTVESLIAGYTAGDKKTSYAHAIATGYAKFAGLDVTTKMVSTIKDQLESNPAMSADDLWSAIGLAPTPGPTPGPPPPTPGPTPGPPTPGPPVPPSVYYAIDANNSSDPGEVQGTSSSYRIKRPRLCC